MDSIRKNISDTIERTNYNINNSWANQNDEYNSRQSKANVVATNRAYQENDKNFIGPHLENPFKDTKASPSQIVDVNNNLLSDDDYYMKLLKKKYGY